MGERGGPGDGGRYEEKESGQQVGSFFAEATDNEKLKAIYGNYGFWSWLRYWWLDTENWVTFMLYDKSYYDYDYKRPGEDYRTVKNEVTSDAELAARLRSMGFGIRKKSADAERLQAEVMEEEKGKHGQS